MTKVEIKTSTEWQFELTSYGCKDQTLLTENPRKQDDRVDY